MSKVSLDSIRSLTFYKDAYTNSRRTTPLPQLTCVGKPCNLFQPDVVRCVNSGGRGLDVEWKCEADLPEQLRLGRVEVSCEGWSRPGDPNVLKGSCALEYRLVRIPNALSNDNPNHSGFLSRILPKDPYETVFMVVWSLLLFFILIAFLKSCFSSRSSVPPRTNNNNPRSRPGGGGGGGWFPGDNNDNGAPPPYSREHKPSSSGNGGWGWGSPGFWTGLGIGGLTGAWWNRRNQPDPPPPPRQRWFWDWERPTGNSWWGPTRTQDASGATASDGWYARSSGTRMTGSTNGGWRGGGERGEGSSNLGRVRTSTGYGGTRVR